jgi:hypothetical protein
MRLWLLPWVVVLLLLGWSLGLAGEPPVPIEGKLLVSGWDSGSVWPGPGAERAYFMEGMSDNVTPAPAAFLMGEVSPLGDDLLYVKFYGYGVTGLWRASITGSDAVELSSLAGLGGTNCHPRWSPDGSQILFLHAESPPPGSRTCYGFEGWVMNADGTDAHRATPVGTGWIYLLEWLPDGYSILFNSENFACYMVDSDGTDLQQLWYTGRPSPDGAYVLWEWANSCQDTVDGEPGGWNRLCLTRLSDGSTERLYRRFIKHSDIYRHIELQQLDAVDPTIDWFGSIHYWAGPASPTWSPKGDRVIFTMAMPFDPEGPYVDYQEEAWVLDIATKDLTKITADNTFCEAWFSWNGPNTASDHPAVTVNNTTVTFSGIPANSTGLTTILRDDDPPAMPAGYQFAGQYYEINTTLPEGSYSLPITITMTYQDEDVPGGDEGALVLLHYNETAQQWEDITTERDTEPNWVKGETWSLSLFGFGLRLPEWVSPLENGTSESAPVGPFKRGRTIPAKFRLNGTDGQPLTDAQAAALRPQLQVFYERATAEGSPVETGENPPDVGAEFRYDANDDVFIYNLSTKDRAWLANYTYGLQVLIGGAKAGEVFFSLK